MKHLLTFSLGILLASQSFGTHVMGFDISFKKVQKDSFFVTVKAYKDCRGINMTSVQVVVTGIGNAFTKTLNANQSSCKDVTGVCPGYCTKCDPNNCNG